MRPGAGHYRPDIDGLRAIAVLLVVGFHFFPHLIPGGYVGVDVFFVISGYLITQILLRDLQIGSFSLASFYARRARRILPALACVLVVTWWIGRSTLLARELLQLGRHIMAGAAFYSNMQLWHESGYFDTDSGLKPLLHLWSLGVEEQFYLVWPLLLLLLPKGRILQAAVVVGALSFGVNMLLTPTHSSFAFYAMPTRFWELMIGCALASLARPPALRKSVQAWLAILALVVLAAASWGFDSASPFPGWRALAPTVSAALLIAFTCQSSFNRHLLGQRHMALLGKISYPLYLWHWPLLSFLNIMQDGQPTLALKLAGIGLSFALAIVTWRFVEIPIQSLAIHPRLTVAAGAGVLLLIYGLGLITVQKGGWPWRFPGKEPHDEYQAGSSVCLKKYALAYDLKEAYCYATSEHPQVALIGDSYARTAFFGELAAHSELARSMIILGGPSCPLLTDVYAATNSACLEVTAAVHQLLQHELSEVRSVILFLRGPRYLSDDGEYDVLGKPGEWPLKTKVGALAKSSKSQLLTAGLARTVEWLHALGKEVTLFMVWPELDFTPQHCFDSRPRRILPVETQQPCAVPVQAVTARRKAYAKVVSEIQRQHPYMKVFDPLPYLCDETSCWGGKEVSWYEDANHLNAKGYSNLSAPLQSFLQDRPMRAE